MSRFPSGTLLHQASNRSGFSLVEVMVALALTGVLLAGLVELFTSNAKNAEATGNLSRIEENGRIALQLLTADIRRAGFLGGNVSVRPITGTLGEEDPDDTCVAADTTWARMVTQPLFGLNVAEADEDDPVDYACIEAVADGSAGAYKRGDILTVRYTSAQPIEPADMADDRPYLRTTVVEGRIFAGKDEGGGNNAIGHVSAESYPLVAHAYYIGLTDRECQGEAIPALFRMAIGDNGQPVVQELLAGVEHLQFRYQTGNQYVDAGDTALNELEEWDEVVAVEVSVLVRSECPEAGFVNDRTFPMGDLLTAYGPADGYRRQLYTSVVAIRNLGIN
jgi:type IV pilus assembly protein PilW